MPAVEYECKNNHSFEKIVKGFIKENKSLFVLYVAVLLFIPLKDIVMPHMIGVLYNKIRAHEKFTWVIITIAIIIILIQVGHGLGDYVESKMFPLMHKYIREQVMSHIFKTHETHYADVQVGEIIAKTVKAPSIIYNFIDQWKGSYIPSALTLVLAACYFAWADRYVFVMFLIVIIVFATFLIRSFSVCEKPATQRDYMFTQVMSGVDDVFQNMMTVMNFDKMHDELKNLDVHHAEYAKLTEDTRKCALSAKYIVIPLMLVFVFGTSYRCYSLVPSKKLPAGTFVSIMIITFISMSIIFGILSSVKDMYLRWGIIKNSMTLFEECKPARTPYILPPRETSGIQIQDLEFSHFSKDQKRVIFNNFNLNIRLNEVTVIIGEIGSGKSTLVNMILKYQTPQKGEIFLNGVPYSNIDHNMLRKLIVYIPQNPILLNRTVYENITYGIESNVDRPYIENLMNTLGLDGFLRALPHGLDTNVGVHGSKLSGGQKQIVWILKIFLINPQIVIMDEPSSSVDESTKKIIRYLLEHAMLNRTVIIITHDQQLLKFADRIIRIASGNVVSDVRPKKQLHISA